MKGLIPLMYPNVYNNPSEYVADWDEFRSSSIAPYPASQAHTIFTNIASGAIGTEIAPPLSYIDTDSLCKQNHTEMSPDHIQALLNVYLLFEGVLQFTVGIIGIISNMLAIPILCGRSMKSMFNKLLICLLTLHTIYILSSLFTVVIWPPWKTNEDDKVQSSSSLWFIILFRFALHPLNQFVLFSSIFITVLMARQRYLAIRHPIEYRNLNQNGNPWISTIKNLIGVLITSGMFTWSIFLETDVELIEEEPQIIDINATHFQFVRHELIYQSYPNFAAKTLY